MMINYLQVLNTKIIIGIWSAILVLCGTSFQLPIYLWNKLSMDNEGRHIAVLFRSKIKLIDTKNPEIVKTANVSIHRVNGMGKVILSGDGEKLIWCSGSKITQVKRNEPNKNVQPIGVMGKTWLDLDASYTGNTWVATIDLPDFYKDGKRHCSPGRRIFAVQEKTEKGTTTAYPVLDVPNCRFINQARLINDSTIVYNYNDYGIFESAKKSNTWTNKKILSVEYKLVRQPVAKEQERLLVWKQFGDDYPGEFELLLSDKVNGEWTTPNSIIDGFRINGGPWHTAISPDGNKIVYLLYHRDKEQKIIQAEFYITRFEFGKWTTPTVLVELQKRGQPWRQTGDVVLSNHNFIYDDMTNKPKFIPSLDGDSKPISIKLL